MRPLIDHSAYADVLERWRGARAMYCKAKGNVGDRLLDAAAGQLFQSYDISLVADQWDVIFWAPGGNMGAMYRASMARRKAAAMLAVKYQRPFVILPQSWSGPDKTLFTFAYAREHESLRHCPSAALAPDFALAYQYEGPDFPDPSAREGFFFRTDLEKTFIPRNNIGDPALMAQTPISYIALAAQYQIIHTNRLHFAISGLIVGRSVVLYSNSYHKNAGVYDLWLKGFDCTFCDDPSQMPHHAPML